VNVAWGETGYIICTSSVFSGLVAVGDQSSVLFGVSQRLAKLGVEEGYEVFSVLSRGGGWCGWCSGPFLSLPRGPGPGVTKGVWGI